MATTGHRTNGPVRMKYLRRHRRLAAERPCHLPHPLPLQLPAHQPPDRIQGIDTLEEHRMHRGGEVPVYGHPAAYLFRKQMKSATLSRGAAEEQSQLG